ncbi:MAG: AAA family ATPase [Candidatus Omnitrophica bacterium]|nr:AAA family ATPase [Candidatus Omnitrophota bacterium]
MYETHWGLSEAPFENTPDPRYLYLSKQHEEGLTRLFYVVRSKKGAGMMTGVFGCGKTLLARAVIRGLQKSGHRIAFITNPRLDPLEMLRMILYELGVSSPPLHKSDVLFHLQELLSNNSRDGHETVVVIDEAHVIQDPDIFEEIRLLLNFQMEEKFLVTLLLIGQPELQDQVDINKAFAQRISIRFHLGPLTEEETERYISHRLSVAGRTDPLFNKEAIQLVYEGAGGIPRRINQICDMCLFTGYVQKRDQVDRPIVEEAMASVEGRS